MNTNRLLLTAALISVLNLGALLPVHAQDSKSKAEASDDQQATKISQNQNSPAHPEKVSEKELLNKKVTKVNKASSFVGMSVKNLQNQTLGKVEDLVFNPESGKIAYAVLSVGGFLGMNEKYIAVPLNALTPAPGENKLVLDADKQRLENAPGFAKNNWPDLDTPAWGAAAGFVKGTGHNGDTKAVGHAGRTGQEQGTGSGHSDQNHFSGTLSSVNPSEHTFTVSGDQGEKTFKLEGNAQIRTDDKNDAKLDDLKVGSKVDVEYGKQGDKTMAKTVRSHQSSSSNKKD